MKTQILVINPGSTSTKIAVYEAARRLHEIFSTTIRHTAKELAPYPRVFQQYEFRKETILNELTANKSTCKISLLSLDAEAWLSPFHQARTLLTTS